MGYPMTFQRLLNRNGLNGSADYGAKLFTLNPALADTQADQFVEGVDLAEVMRQNLRFALRMGEEANSRWSLLCGDLRRLRVDTTDEKRICQQIATKVGLDADDVAAVLKEWMAT